MEVGLSALAGTLYVVVIVVCMFPAQVVDKIEKLFGKDVDDEP